MKYSIRGHVGGLQWWAERGGAAAEGAGGRDDLVRRRVFLRIVEIYVHLIPVAKPLVPVDGVIRAGDGLVQCDVWH